MTTQEIEIGRKRLEELADFLEMNVPENNFGMTAWGMDKEHSTPTDFLQRLEKHECGTTACAMGWAAVLFPELLMLQSTYPKRNPADAQKFYPVLRAKPRQANLDAAEGVFSLSMAEAGHLFLPNDPNITRMQEVERIREFVRKSRQGYTVHIVFSSGQHEYRWIKRSNRPGGGYDS